MKHLTDDKYIQIIKDNKVPGIYAEVIAFMREWDEVRTDINPEAAWYPFDTEEPKEKFEYISRAAVVNTLIEFAKEIYEKESLYEPLIETVIEIESRISDLPIRMIKNEVMANDDK